MKTAPLPPAMKNPFWNVGLRARQFAATAPADLSEALTEFATEEIQRTLDLLTEERAMVQQWYVTYYGPEGDR